MRIFHWSAVLGTGAALRGCGPEGEPVDVLPGTVEEPTVEPRPVRGRTGPLPRL